MIFLLSSDIGTKSNTSRFVRPLLIWLFPDITEPSIQTVHYWVRKAAHFTEYGILALLGARALANSSRLLLKNWRFQLSFVLVVLVSLADEAFQSLVNDRTATVYDSLLDCAGGLTMLLALYIFRITGRGR